MPPFRVVVDSTPGSPYSCTAESSSTVCPHPISFMNACKSPWVGQMIRMIAKNYCTVSFAPCLPFQATYIQFRSFRLASSRIESGFEYLGTTAISIVGRAEVAHPSRMTGSRSISTRYHSSTRISHQIQGQVTCLNPT